MGLRFRKSFTLVPGIRLNISKTGFSLTLGVPGASVNIGKDGAYLNAGIPGTGIFTREKLAGRRGSSGDVAGQGGNKVDESRENLKGDGKNLINWEFVKFGFSDDGTLIARDYEGNLLPQHILNEAKSGSLSGSLIRNFLDKTSKEIKDEINSIGLLHLETPSPSTKPTYIPKPFKWPTPKPPSLKDTSDFMTRFVWGEKRRKLEKENEILTAEYERALKVWKEKKETSEASERERQKFLEADIYRDTAAMNKFLQTVFSELDWPRETTVSWDLFDNGNTLFLDVDLPEIEDLPNKTVTVLEDVCELRWEDMQPELLNYLYKTHIHGIAFRSIGTAFYALPNLQRVVFSGYSQRTNESGEINDDYLLSVRVDRSNWQETIDFNNLQKLDPTEGISRFEHKSSISEIGRFDRIQPFSPDARQA